jgi:antirestriction protein ArdC
LLLPLRHEGTPYQEINTLLLWLAANQKEYHSPRWMTYRQAVALGANVKKGEKSTTVVMYGTFDKPDDNNPDTGPKKGGSARPYRVFNAQQIEGLDTSFMWCQSPRRTLGHRPIQQYIIGSRK